MTPTTLAHRALRRLRADALRVALTAAALALAADTADRHLTHPSRAAGPDLLHAGLRLATALRPALTP
ncbi:hypothetical protein [Frankia sp. AgB32]|uniref:hypothetical protein n=1 Tax=Frankia sp. AgB32 TaxID=631119 RepID=UPI0024B0861C|nr:hypothetical protein [Frankia sp. AgB32]